MQGKRSTSAVAVGLTLAAMLYLTGGSAAAKTIVEGAEPSQNKVYIRTDDHGIVHIADSANRRVVARAGDGRVLAVWELGDSEAGTLNSPARTLLSSTGHLVTTYRTSDRALRVPAPRERTSRGRRLSRCTCRAPGLSPPFSLRPQPCRFRQIAR